MLFKLVFFAFIGLTISTAGPCEEVGGQCGTDICGANEECSSCGQNECNTYSCAYPTPTCVLNCFVPDLECVCKPNYARKTPCGPCEPLQCPCTLPTEELCDGTVCGENEECSGCGQNSCNTYTCDNPTPTCVAECFIYEPLCVCKPYYARETPCGPCVPLNCLYF